MTKELNGALVYYEDRGQGKPLLALHGWGGQVNSFLPLIREFQKTRRVVALDFPGHGQSSEPPEPWSVTEYAQMTARFICELGIEGCDIAAHSFGARVAILLAATQGDLVGKLLLTGAAGIKPPPSPQKRGRGQIYRALRGAADNKLTRALLGDQWVEARREDLVQRFGSSDYKALSKAMRQTFNRVIGQDLRPYLAKIQAPTLLIWGAKDVETPLWMGKAMEEEIPDAGLVVFEDCGHFAYLDRYADFAVIAHKFLD